MFFFAQWGTFRASSRFEKKASKKNPESSGLIKITSGSCFLVFQLSFRLFSFYRLDGEYFSYLKNLEKSWSAALSHSKVIRFASGIYFPFPFSAPPPIFDYFFVEKSFKHRKNLKESSQKEKLTSTVDFRSLFPVNLHLIHCDCCFFFQKIIFDGFPNVSMVTRVLKGSWRQTLPLENINYKNLTSTSGCHFRCLFSFHCSKLWANAQQKSEACQKGDVAKCLVRVTKNRKRIPKRSQKKSQKDACDPENIWGCAGHALMIKLRATLRRKRYRIG